ncbi:MAG: GNAT family N-acetyltransferase [Propionibacterium sp.]|nr:GNAT family N-acetyltransferase [Propionibacterium sp.]
MTEPRIVDLVRDHPGWDSALTTLQVLRPRLTREVLDDVLAAGTPQGLRYTGLFVGDDCVAIGGWRVMACTARIRRFFVEDLATAAPVQSRGYGRQLFDALLEEARALDCRTVELDSGVTMHGAHRFYLRERMNIAAHHFELWLGPRP